MPQVLIVGTPSDIRELINGVQQRGNLRGGRGRTATREIARDADGNRPNEQAHSRTGRGPRPEGQPTQAQRSSGRPNAGRQAACARQGTPHRQQRSTEVSSDEVGSAAQGALERGGRTQGKTGRAIREKRAPWEFFYGTDASEQESSDGQDATAEVLGRAILEATAMARPVLGGLAGQRACDATMARECEARAYRGGGRPNSGPPMEGELEGEAEAREGEGGSEKPPERSGCNNGNGHCQATAGLDEGEQSERGLIFALGQAGIAPSSKGGWAISQPVHNNPIIAEGTSLSWQRLVGRARDRSRKRLKAYAREQAKIAQELEAEIEAINARCINQVPTPWKCIDWKAVAANDTRSDEDFIKANPEANLAPPKARRKNGPRARNR
jgi:hypothetical protein